MSEICPQCVLVKKEYKNAQATLQCKMPDCGTAFHFLAFLPQLNLKKPLVIFLPNSSTSFHVESDWSGGS